MYYFAYGANTDPNYLVQYIDNENIDIFGSAYVENYILKYRNVNIPNIRSGVANLESRKGSKTYGVVYNFDNPDILSNIDTREGYISNNNPENIYNKKILQCKLLDTDETISCYAYIMNDLKKKDERKPRFEYLSYLKNGNKIHGLPKEHLQRIQYLEK